MGVMEATRVDERAGVGDAYLAAIINRYERRDLQGQRARRVAEALKTQGYIIFFRQGCTEFWVYNLTQPGGWVRLNAEEVHRSLRNL